MDTDAVREATAAGAGTAGFSVFALGIDAHQILGIALGVVFVYALRRAETWLTATPAAAAPKG